MMIWLIPLIIALCYIAVGVCIWISLLNSFWGFLAFEPQVFFGVIFGWGYLLIANKLNFRKK